MSAQTRQQLCAAVQRDEQALQEAVTALRRAAQQSLDVRQRARQQLSAHPVGWVAAAVLLGLWLGQRAK
jgi:hypothetical protein